MRSTTPVHVRLRELIAESGRTTADVAGAAGLNHEAVRQILRGERTNPTVQTVGRVLAALGRTWADLDRG